MKKQFLFKSIIVLFLLAGPWLAGTTIADGRWYIRTLDSNGSVGIYTSIALDAGGNPHISYSGNSDLKYAKYMSSCAYVLTGDNNNDCEVDFRDCALMTKNWLINCDVTPGDPSCVHN